MLREQSIEQLALIWKVERELRQKNPDDGFDDECRQYLLAAMNDVCPVEKHSEFQKHLSKKEYRVLQKEFTDRT